MEIRVRNTAALPAAAKHLLKFSSHEKVFLFEGGMGAGKTTFIKIICEILGVKDSASSPTYSLVNEYESDRGKIFHFDFFRIKNEAEAYDLGFEEYLSSGNYCFIEWPEKIESLWPEHYVKVNIKQTVDKTRILFLTKI